MTVTILCQLYYDEDYSVGKEIIAKWLKENMDVSLDENYCPTDGTTLTWRLPSGEFSWGAVAVYKGGRTGGLLPNSDRFVTLSSDLASLSKKAGL